MWPRYCPLVVSNRRYRSKDALPLVSLSRKRRVGTREVLPYLPQPLPSTTVQQKDSSFPTAAGGPTETHCKLCRPSGSLMGIFAPPGSGPVAEDGGGSRGGYGANRTARQLWASGDCDRGAFNRLCSCSGSYQCPHWKACSRPYSSHGPNGSPWQCDGCWGFVNEDGLCEGESTLPPYIGFLRRDPFDHYHHHHHHHHHHHRCRVSLR